MTQAKAQVIASRNQDDDEEEFHGFDAKEIAKAQAKTKKSDTTVLDAEQRSLFDDRAGEKVNTSIKIRDLRVLVKNVGVRFREASAGEIMMDGGKEYNEMDHQEGDTESDGSIKNVFWRT